MESFENSGDSENTVRSRGCQSDYIEFRCSMQVGRIPNCRLRNIYRQFGDDTIGTLRFPSKISGRTSVFCISSKWNETGGLRIESRQTVILLLDSRSREKSRSLFFAIIWYLYEDISVIFQTTLVMMSTTFETRPKFWQKLTGTNADLLRQYLAN